MSEFKPSSQDCINECMKKYDSYTDQQIREELNKVMPNSTLPDHPSVLRKGLLRMLCDEKCSDSNGIGQTNDNKTGKPKPKNTPKFN